MGFGSEVEDDEGYLDEQKGEDEEKKEDDLNEGSELEKEKDFEDDQIKSGEFGDDDQELPEEKEESIWDDIDWSEDKQGEGEKTIWDDIDWSEDIHGEREKNEKEKNDDQNEEYNNEDYVENVESQSTSTVLTQKSEEIEGNVEHQEKEEEIEIRPEECQNDTEPIINTDESEFIKDVEELAEYAREIKAEDEDIEPQAEKENAAYYAEQYYESLKEKEVVNDHDSKEAQETEELRQEVAEELKGDQESNYKSAELEEEATIEGSKEITSTEEFEYLWGVRERLDREGKSPEEIEEVMHEAEEMYETLKNAEKLYEEQELEKLKLVDHEDEASEEDLKEELDRIDLVEQAIELEENLVQQGKSQEEIDTRVEESIETAKFEEKLETIIEQQELEKLKQVDHEDEATEEDLKEDLDRIDLVEQAVELEEKLVQQGKSQEEIDTRVEEAIGGTIETAEFEEKLENINELEQESIVNEKLKKHDLEINEQNSNENVENKENLEVLKPELDAIESESEDNKDLLEEDTKLRSEESDEEENEHLQELYRQETGRRPMYSRQKTKGYSQWLEQRELGSEKIKNYKSESEKKKEIEEEGWKTTLKRWIKEASEEECNAELKSELKKALENYEEFESLTRKFLELYKKSQHEKLSEIEKNRLKSLTERLQELDPIQLELLANIRAFKVYFNNHLWELMNRFFANRVLSKFFKHISQKYKELKEVHKVKEFWMEKQKELTYKKREEAQPEWVKILKNWIKQSNKNEISEDYKSRLIKIINKFSKIEELNERIHVLFGKYANKTITENELYEFLEITNIIEPLEAIEQQIFLKLVTFQNFFYKNYRWYPYFTEREKLKYPKFLAQELRYLLKQQNSIKNIEVNKNSYKNSYMLQKYNIKFSNEEIEFFKNHDIDLFNEEIQLNKEDLLKDSSDTEEQENLRVKFKNLVSDKNTILELLRKTGVDEKTFTHGKIPYHFKWMRNRIINAKIPAEIQKSFIKYFYRLMNDDNFGIFNTKSRLFSCSSLKIKYLIRDSLKKIYSELVSNNLIVEFSNALPCNNVPDFIRDLFFYANEIEDLMNKNGESNKFRHNRLEELMMLVNDNIIAIEPPVWDKSLLITGHIDFIFLIYINSKWTVFVTDYKPNVTLDKKCNFIKSFP